MSQNDCTEMETLLLPSRPSFFFDMKNTKYLPQELFSKYMIVLEILSQERLSEHFTGDADVMAKLMNEITVFDIFVVTTAIEKNPEMLSGYDFTHVPSSFDCWESRITPLEQPSRSSIITRSEARQAQPACDSVTINWDDNSMIELSRMSEPTFHNVAPETYAHEIKESSCQRSGPAFDNAVSDFSETNTQTPGVITGDVLRYVDDVRAAVRKGTRYGSVGLAAAGVAVGSTLPWHTVFETLRKVYSPALLVFTSSWRENVSFIEGCLSWESLPEVVFTTDRGYFLKYSGSKCWDRGKV